MKKRYSFVFGLILLLIPFLNVNASSKFCLDYPSTNEIYDNVLYVQGWIMSDEAVNTEMYIDNNLINTEINRYERSDVIKAINGYGGLLANPTPGYMANVDTSNYSTGSHIFKIKFFNANHRVIGEIVKTFTLNNNLAKMVIDAPVANSDWDKELLISGWIMSPNTNGNLRTYIDGNEIDLDISRVLRGDVIEKIKGYGNSYINSLPGFISKVDINNLNDGLHTLKIEYVNQNGKVLTSQSKNFNIKNDIADLRIDYPKSFIDGTNLNLKGWVMSPNYNVKIKTYLDDELLNINYNRYERKDVLNAIKGYGDYNNNPTPGYYADYNLTNYKDGNHNLRVEVVGSNDQVINYLERAFTLKKYKNKISLDSISNGSLFEGINLDVRGWLLTNNKNSKIEVYVDDSIVEVELNRILREDAIKVYGSSFNLDINKLPGYSGYVDMSNYKDGLHTIRVVEKDNNTGEETVSATRNFTLKKYKNKISLDSISNGSLFEGINLEVRGWLLTNNKNSKIEVYVDDSIVEVELNRTLREDAIRVYGSSFNLDINKLPGYSGFVDMSNYKDGLHTIRVVEKDNNTGEETVFVTRKFKLRKYDGFICLDYPQKGNFSNSSDLLVQGWELSESDNSVIKVYIDNKEINVNRYEREDVLLVYQNDYNGRDANELPGFTVNVNLNNYSVGNHSLKIELYTKYNDLIDSVNKEFYIYDKLYFGIDVSHNQGNIDWSSVKSYGIDFAIMRLGYGDNWVSQDDKRFLSYVDNAVANGIPYGVYLYSYASRLVGATGLNVDSQSVDSEIAHTLRILNGLSQTQKSQFKLPVFIDMEDDSTLFVGKNVLTQIADRYCTAITNAGYKCGIYANRSWFNNNLDRVLLESKYEIWLADWTYNFNTVGNYNGRYQVRQYADNGTVSGISGDVDLDVSYKKYW